MGRPLEQSETAQNRPNQARQFVMHECLGRGGFGEVYRSTMVSPGGLETEVAIKVLRLDVDPSSDAVSRLRDEGKLLAALRHPAILRAHDLALLDGRVALVTEYIDGADLHRCTTGTGRLSIRAAVGVIEAIAEALDAAWNRQFNGEPLRLVHRDIKPSNIRLGSHGEVKLLDFGIARSDEVDREARTGTGSTIGSLAYMAPERFSRGSPGPEADVYALGCTLYEALVGTRLHDDPVPVEMFRLAATPDAHGRHVADALNALPPEAEGVRELLGSMLVHDKSLRPTAGEVANRCDALIDSLPGLSLKRWARTRSWGADSELEGTFNGRTITEGSLTGGGVTDGTVLPINTASDTFNFQADFKELSVTETGAVERVAFGVLPRRGGWKLFAGGTALLGLLVLGGFWAVGWNAIHLQSGGQTLHLEIDDGVSAGVEVLGRKHVFKAGPAAHVPPLESAPAVPLPPSAMDPPVAPQPAPVNTPSAAPPTPTASTPQADVGVPTLPASQESAPPDPAPVEPAPVEPAPVEPAPVPTATVRVIAKSSTAKLLKVTLSSGEHGTYPLSGTPAIPVGVYDIRVNGVVTGNQIVVRAGVVNAIECNGLAGTCSSKL